LGLPGFDLQRGLMMLIPLVLSLTVHEFAHAWSAWKLGDDTAARMGRLTLNPIPHIDPIGTLLLPLIGVPFGWARPVPVNPSRFRRNVSQSFGMAVTAAAGPLSNLLMAVVATVVLAVLYWYVPAFSPDGAIAELLWVMVGLNVNLALFNLIPVPPLDGSRILDHFVPQGLRPLWDRVVLFAPFLLLGVVIFARSIIGGPSAVLGGLLMKLFVVLRPA
jgi:Zn-dependent protease